MHCSPIPAMSVPVMGRAVGARFPVSLGRWIGRLLLCCLAIDGAIARGATAPVAPDEFSKLVKLAPLVVNGKSLAVSIYARARSDRRYGEEFSEKVVKVVYESVTDSTGRGLVIVGAKGEPHPIFVYRKFLALADEGKLDPAIGARGSELTTILDRWQRNFNRRKSSGRSVEGVDFDFDRIATALPLPLVGVGAKLYQLAWEEKFDDGKVEARLRALRSGDLERSDLFKSFDWVFYLPPKGAFDQVLDDLIAAALKRKEVGFFARTAIKSVLLVVKPKIRRAIEAMRQGIMFMTLVQAQTDLPEKDVWDLTGAYVEVYVPFDSDSDEKPPGKNDHERAVNAVREELRRNAEKTQGTDAVAPPAESANSG